MPSGPPQPPLVAVSSTGQLTLRFCSPPSRSVRMQPSSGAKSRWDTTGKPTQIVWLVERWQKARWEVVQALPPLQDVQTRSPAPREESAGEQAEILRERSPAPHEKFNVCQDEFSALSPGEFSVGVVRVRKDLEFPPCDP